jgi:hypothetical protein
MDDDFALAGGAVVRARMWQRQEEQQIPPLRCGMTNKKATATAKQRNSDDNSGFNSAAVFLCGEGSSAGGRGLLRLGLRRVGV